MRYSFAIFLFIALFVFILFGPAPLSWLRSQNQMTRNLPVAETQRTSQEPASPNQVAEESNPPAPESPSKAKIVEADIQVIKVNPLENRQDSSEKNPARRSYVKLGDVELHSSSSRVKMEFETPLKNYVTLLFVGGDGHSKIEDVVIQFTDGRQVKATSLHGEYFTNDWYRFEGSEQAISAIIFSGQSLDSARSRLSVLTQVPFN